MVPVSPYCKVAALCLHQSCRLKCWGATYRSKQELIGAGLFSLSSSDTYCKDDPETCVFSVLSGIVGSAQRCAQTGCLKQLQTQMLNLGHKQT